MHFKRADYKVLINDFKKRKAFRRQNAIVKKRFFFLRKKGDFICLRIKNTP